ncbi:hypothetical protein TrVE_jg13649 [Triparma verrucosa]|uniref:Uncharacterized protein n=1 Tax=Triparma verrucosa TaxID=1606542 RepID=A0A9W7F8S0_9STRA|nr:hypothetical protein TrVE_jg13649 [Triparma verrucosa]
MSGGGGGRGVNLGHPFGGRFLIFPADITDARGFTFESLVPKVPTAVPPVKPGYKENKWEKKERAEKEEEFNIKGDKWCTLIIKDLPGAWFGLSEESLEWDDQSTIQSLNDDLSTAVSTSSQSLATLDSLKNLKPFMGALETTFEEFGAIKNMDAVLSKRAADDQSEISSQSSFNRKLGNTSSGPPGSISTHSGMGLTGMTMGMLREEDAGGLSAGLQGVGDRPNSPMLDRWVAEGGGGMEMNGAGIEKKKYTHTGVEDEGLEGEDGEPTALALIGDENDEDEMNVEGDDFPFPGADPGGDPEPDPDPATSSGGEGEGGGEGDGKIADPSSNNDASTTTTVMLNRRPLPPTPQQSTFSSSADDRMVKSTATSLTEGGKFTSKKLTPLSELMCGQCFDLRIQFKSVVSYTKALTTLRSKIMCLGKVDMDLNKAEDDNNELFFVPLDVTFDVKGYFSASMIDYRERQARSKRKDELRSRLIMAKQERVRVKNAKEFLKKCERMIESMRVDLAIVKDNEVCMKHRPTEVSVLGASDKVDEADRKVRQIKTTLLPTTEGGLASLVKGLKNVVVRAKKAVKQAVVIADKAVVAKAMSLPTLAECLEKQGCGLFMKCLERAGMADISGCTILAPKDDAFLGEGVEGFDDESFDVHIIDGPYNTGDMLNLNSGYTQPRHQDIKCSIRTRMDLGGKFTFWLAGDSEPRRIIEAVEPDVPVQGGTVVHIVDKILYPSDAMF